MRCFLKTPPINIKLIYAIISKMSTCLICKRIDAIKENNNLFFVKELKTGYVVLGDNQLYKGYTLFLFKNHVQELHELDNKTRTMFLTEMSQVAKAVYKSFSPDKLNYELLGNSHPHMHWHIFPRYKNDPNFNKPVWFNLMINNKIDEISNFDLNLLKKTLLNNLK